MRKKGNGKKRNMRGKGWLSDAWSGLKSGVSSVAPVVWNTAKDFAPTAGKFIKDNGLVSKGLSMIGQDGYANMAKAVGLGKKRGGRKMKGAGGFGINLPFGGLNVGWGKKRGMRGGAMVNSVTSSVAPSAIRV